MWAFLLGCGLVHRGEADSHAGSLEKGGIEKKKAALTGKG